MPTESEVLAATKVIEENTRLGREEMRRAVDLFQSASTTPTTKKRNLLERVRDHIQEWDAKLDAMVAKQQPEDEQAFRLARRAEWRAAEQVGPSFAWGEDNVELGREAAQRVVDGAAVDEIDLHLAVEFTELMRKIAA